MYWFYIAAGLGAFRASVIAVPTGDAQTKSSLMLFIFLCDVFSMWIGGVVTQIDWGLPPVQRRSISRHSLDLDAWPEAVGSTRIYLFRTTITRLPPQTGHSPKFTSSSRAGESGGIFGCRNHQAG